MKERMKSAELDASPNHVYNSYGKSYGKSSMSTVLDGITI